MRKLPLSGYLAPANLQTGQTKANQTKKLCAGVGVHETGRVVIP